MNRRRMLRGSVVAAFCGLVGRRSLAAAQEPEATPDNVFRFPLEHRIASAAANFEASGDSTRGPVRFGFAADLFQDAAAAKAAFARFDEFTDAFLDEFSAAVEGDFTVRNRQELPAPRVGELRTAEAIDVTLLGVGVTFVLLFAQKGKILHRWMGLGLENPADDLFELAEEHMKFEDVDPDNDEEMFSLIPSLDDMPEGWVVSDAGGVRIDRYDEATPADV